MSRLHLEDNCQSFFVVQGQVSSAQANIQPPVHKTASLSSGSHHAVPCAASSIHRTHQPATSAYPAASSRYQRAASAPPWSSFARACLAVRRKAAVRASGLLLGPEDWISVQRDDLALVLVAIARVAGLVGRDRRGS